MLARFASQALASGLAHSTKHASVAAAAQRCLHDPSGSNQVKATTIICVRKGDEVVVMGDGQVTLGDMIVKPNVRKVRRLGESAIGGFAGSAADGISLFERLESKLEEHPGQLRRAAVELAKMWRQDKVLRHLQAQMIVADAETTLAITGNGDIIESHDGIMGVGSGSGYAEAAARALIDVDAPNLTAFAIAKKAMKVAGDLCIYTNQVHSWEGINSPDSAAATEKATTP